MSFEVYGVSENEGSGGVTVDFDAMNRAVVEAAQLQQRETLVGYVSMIVDLGTQEQEDAEMPFTGSEEDERAAIAQYPNTYFKDGVDQQSKKPVRLKCWPQKPQQSIAIAVDFPDVIVDKGVFFGESKPLPLRLWLGGQFYTQENGMVIGRPTALKVNKKLGAWSFDQKHLCYKMAVAAKLINPGEVFLPQQIDQLLGQAFQFEAQVYFKENKGKSYYTEYVKFSTGLGRGQAAPEPLTTPLIVQFNKENDEQAVKELRSHVVNTIKRAANYEGSVIQGQIDKVKGTQQGGSTPPPLENTTPQEKKPFKTPPKQEGGVATDFDDDSIPF